MIGKYPCACYLSNLRSLNANARVYLLLNTLPLKLFLLTQPQPPTTKQYKIMEKTAVFMSTQNMQMEIILRTKQKNNQQFQ